MAESLPQQTASRSTLVHGASRDQGGRGDSILKTHVGLNGKWCSFPGTPVSQIRRLMGLAPFWQNEHAQHLSATAPLHHRSLGVIGLSVRSGPAPSRTLVTSTKTLAMDSQCALHQPNGACLCAFPIRDIPASGATEMVAHHFSAIGLPKGKGGRTHVFHQTFGAV
jgi:hypothetical protein